MKIQEFPLSWRLTDSRHTLFPETVLSQLQPLEADEERSALERGQNVQRGSSSTSSANISDGEGSAWLRAQYDAPDDLVTISWSPECALRTSWRIFTEYWSDFCYPSSDDVAI